MSLHHLLLVTLVGLCSVWPTTLSAREVPLSKKRRNEIVQVVEKSRAAVVNIHSERTSYTTTSSGFSSPQKANGMGTGIIIDPRGYIVTNHHVVDEVTTLKVRLWNRESHEAKLIAKDKLHDLAIIKIDAQRPLPTITLGTSADLMVGETVVAIGNAYGYEHTVSVGIISALHRDVVLNKEISYKSLIQTDASINPGNSGGPMLNIEGELVGVNVAIRAGAQGISFAIPVDQMLEAVSRMMAQKRQEEIRLDFTYNDELLTTPSPSRKVKVENILSASPEKNCPLRKGDEIIQVGDSRIQHSMDLERLLLDRKAGERIPLVVRRGSNEVKTELVLQSAKVTTTITDLAWKELGLRLSTTDTEAVKRNNPTLRGGLLITEVRSGSLAAKAGLQSGDLLVGLHIWETLNFDHVKFVLQHEERSTFNPLRFHVLREGQLHRGTFAAE
jgi:serine protease Do